MLYKNEASVAFPDIIRTLGAGVLNFLQTVSPLNDMNLLYDHYLNLLHEY